VSTQALNKEQKKRLRALQVSAREARKALARSLCPNPPGKSNKSKKKRKLDADTQANFKKICMHLEASEMMARLPLPAMEAVKKAIMVKLQAEGLTFT